METIQFNGNTYLFDIAEAFNTILVFPSEEMCKDFLDKFRDLIEQAKIFL